VEIVDDTDTPVPTGSEGRILVTNLHNYAMPLIRYDIGDIGVLSNHYCSCGRGLPVLAKLQGRVTDIITTVSKGAISGLALNRPFRELAYLGIEQFQIVQESQNDIVIKIVMAPHHDRDQTDRIVTEVLARYNAILGNDMNIAVNFVDQIVAEANGKRKAILSRVHN
jgi:phenylacetate-CoA ligase